MPPADHPWNVIGSSVIGTSHVRRGLPCQDEHATLVLPNGTLILAVADGAGSASRAGEGSLRVVQSSLQYLANQLSQHPPQDEAALKATMVDTLVFARAALEELAGETPIRDFATTLLLVAVTREHLATLQVGDGGIVIREPSGTLHVLTEAGDNEYINETRFLTSSDYRKGSTVKVLPASSANAIAVFTDGVQSVALQQSDNTAHPPFFTPLFAFAAQPGANPDDLTGLLASDRINDLTDDDKTLILAVRNDAVRNKALFDPPEFKAARHEPA